MLVVKICIKYNINCTDRKTFFQDCQDGKGHLPKLSPLYQVKNSVHNSIMKSVSTELKIHIAYFYDYLRKDKKHNFVLEISCVIPTVI